MGALSGALPARAPSLRFLALLAAAPLLLACARLLSAALFVALLLAGFLAGRLLLTRLDRRRGGVCVPAHRLADAVPTW